MNSKILFRKFSWLLIALLVLLPLVSLAVVDISKGIVPCGNEPAFLPNGSANPAYNPCHLSDLMKLVDNLIYFALFYLAAPLGTLSIATGGLLMITARGDTGQLERGKSIFYNTVIGFLIAFGAYLIVETVIYGLTGNANLADWLKGKVQ